METEFNPKKNQKKSFKKIISTLNEYAKDKGKSELEVLEEFIQDLENIGVEGYEKNLPLFGIKKSISEATIKSLLNYLKTIERNKKIQESRASQTEAKESQASQEGKAEEAKPSDDEKREMFDALVKENWESILEVVDRKVNKKLQDMSGILDTRKTDAVRRDVLFECLRGLESKTQERALNGQEETPLAKAIHKKLEDEIYYEEVRFFTEDFRFLKQNYMIFVAEKGNTGRYFVEAKNNLKFIYLQTDLQNITSSEYCDEETAIEIMLKKDNGEIDDVTNRILEARRQVLMREPEI